MPEKRGEFAEMNAQSRVSLGQHEPLRFNMMLVGESGAGKRSFLTSMMKSYLPDTERFHLFQAPPVTTVGNIFGIAEIGQFDISAETGHVNFHMYAVPGYGDGIDNFHSFDAICKALSNRWECWRTMDAQVMTEESRLQEDARIHCILYFIGPHSFKAIDREFIRRASVFAPIVPIVSKSDALTNLERQKYLQHIQMQLHELETISALGTPIIYDFCEVGIGETPPSISSSPAQSPLQSSRSSNGSVIRRSVAFPHELAYANNSSDPLPVNAAANQSADSLLGLEIPTDDVEDIILSPPCNGSTSQQAEESMLCESIYTRIGSILAVSPHGGHRSGLGTYNEEEHYYRMNSAMASPRAPAVAAEGSTGLAGVRSSEGLNLTYEAAIASPIAHHHTHEDPRTAQLDCLVSDSMPSLIPVIRLNADIARVPNIFGIIAGADQSGIRSYPWGILRIDDHHISDFRRLQHLVFEQGHLRGMKKVAQAKMMEFYHTRHQVEQMQQQQSWLSVLMRQGVFPVFTTFLEGLLGVAALLLVVLAYECTQKLPNGYLDDVINHTAIAALQSIPFCFQAINCVASVVGLGVVGVTVWYLASCVLRRDRRTAVWNHARLASISMVAAAAVVLHRGLLVLAPRLAHAGIVPTMAPPLQSSNDTGANSHSAKQSGVTGTADGGHHSILEQFSIANMEPHMHLSAVSGQFNRTTNKSLDASSLMSGSDSEGVGLAGSSSSSVSMSLSMSMAAFDSADDLRKSSSSPTASPVSLEGKLAKIFAFWRTD